ncbi:DNA polymerase-3 subunit epsilon [Rhodoblastus acidophilus]|uniref:DNA polymerase-3 subunit epsilon n=1 Tax=Rhodoblastus acidophilus TaxID=1074 RepID=A0A212RHF6_RHOAC|nr:3'-5' exonuclease [Rhodoblastus acidophilus]PPQ39566.1 hypothetical protein CKO16_04815 [Rhodoblastus acidophilus]RAI24349.1 hypothetical protein CH337_00195 [Rhodoblastus acidophilus]SNB71691.1 DNA polymerase-3 subunit epsilon [Rhodoblastus acidophilus]
MSDHDEVIEVLEKTGDYRVLRRVDLSAIPVVDIPADFSLQCVVVLDAETTGLDPDRCSIVELALRAVWYDEEFRVVALGEPRSWLEDPGEPLSSEIQKLTGLNDADLHGKVIDAAAVMDIVSQATLVVSHNALFDRRVFEKRFPLLRNLPWACSCREIRWAERGFDGRGLGSLLMQSRLFSDKAHRAGADVDAVIVLLMQRHQDQTALAELVAAAGRTTWRVSAIGAHYDLKTYLKERGYFWNPRECFWWRELEESQLEAEKAWLASAVYAPRHYPSAPAPAIERITSRERHRR